MWMRDVISLTQPKMFIAENVKGLTDLADVKETIINLEIENCGKIKDFTVRETKNSGIVTLPNKVYHDVYVDFELTQKSMYDHVRNEMQILVQ